MFNYELRFQFPCVTFPLAVLEQIHHQFSSSPNIARGRQAAGLVSWIDGDCSYSNTMLGKPP